VDARAQRKRVGPAGVLFGPTGEVKGSELGRSEEKKKKERWAAGKGNQPRHRFVHFFSLFFSILIFLHIFKFRTCNSYSNSNSYPDFLISNMIPFMNINVTIFYISIFPPSPYLIQVINDFIPFTFLNFHFHYSN
jgi:hypothetical protein